MIKLNLIPTTEKESYKLEIFRRFVIFFSIGIFSITLIFIALLGAEYFLLSLQIDPEIKRLEAEKATEKFKKVEDFENQIKETNKKIADIVAIKNQISLIVPIIEQITNDVSGKNSYLQSIVIDKAASTGSIKGFSLTRDQVVTIQDNLKNDALLDSINAPYANFLKQKNVDFSFDFKLKK